MPVFDRYMMKNLFIATLFVALTLTVVIFLTQSLRFLELVIEAGATSSAFWVLTLLALPRFFEVLVPLALVAGVLFLYNRMTSDSELVVMRSCGASPMSLARPAITLSLLVTIFLMIMTMWAAPKSLQTMQSMRQEIKAQFSALLFRDGVFNKIGNGLTLYIRDKNDAGELLGIMIYDSRDNTKVPSTVIAERGALLLSESGYEVLVYDGARHEYNAQTQTLNKLNFDRYVVDLPNTDTVNTRWRQPDERTVMELLKPDLSNARDVKSIGEFKLELHKRILSPLLALTFAVVGCALLLLGPVDRRGNMKRIVIAVLSVVFIQGMFIVVYNVAKQYAFGLPLMYLPVLLPLLIGLYMLSGYSEGLRRQFLYVPKATKMTEAA